MVLSGKKVTIVPVLSDVPTSFTGSIDFPLWYSCSQILPSRCTVATSFSERALTQLTPTPCRPPETL